MPAELPWVLQALLPDGGPPRFYPELVAAFEGIGFQKVGGLIAKFHRDADREALVASIAAVRARPREHRTIDQAAVLWAQLMHHDMRAEAKAVRWGLMTGLRWKLRYARWLRPEFRGGW